MAEAARINVVELSVSELSMALKRTIEDGFDHVRVRGELGNVKYHSSGHIYLDLKDDKACLAGVVWRNAAPRIKIKLEAGLEVVVTGRITTYPGQSKYQIVVETLEPAGLGALMALLEERKKKLAAEGLFDEARKQLLPFLPRVIGVVTSPTGAVIRDILHRLGDRFPRQVLVWPVRVQGEDAPAEVAAAIRGFNTLPQDGPLRRPDVLIVARGGGSLEDLWTFNEEIVVRAAADSLIPLISAIGHETDITLIDFAADKRAPTPTAAAEMAVPVRSELLARCDSQLRRLRACWLRGMENRRTELRAATRALPNADELLALPRQRLDTAAERLPRALRANAQLHHTHLSRVASRLSPQLLRTRLSYSREQVAAFGARGKRALRANAQLHHAHLSQVAARLSPQLLRTRLSRSREQVMAFAERNQRAYRICLERHADRIRAAGQLLAAFSYRGVLNRGFALVRDPEGKPLRLAASVPAGSAIQIEFFDGRLDARVDGAKKDEGAVGMNVSKNRSRGGTGSSGQGSLFG